MDLKRNKKILIRADASSQIGVGHMMRALALGQLLSDHGYEIHFATVAHEGFSADLLSVQRFRVYDLTSKTAWEESADLEQLLKIAKDTQPAWVVLDGYHFTGIYERILKQSGYKILRVDDVPQGHYYADVILNQNFGAENFVYEKEPYASVLTGLQNVLLRREFRSLDPLPRPVKNPDQWQIMVSLGGSSSLDSVYDLMDKALKDLPHVSFKKVLGQENIALEMLNSDMAIVSGGSTMWELVYMGVPFFTVALNEKQEAYLPLLSQKGLCVNLGFFKRLTIENVRQSVLQFIRDREGREQMKRRLQDSMDRRVIGQKVLEKLMAVV